MPLAIGPYALDNNLAASFKRATESDIAFAVDGQIRASTLPPPDSERLAALLTREEVQTVSLEKLNVVAPRAGHVDSLPYKLGDQAPVGSPLAILLVGDSPYARVYVPEPMRATVKVGQAARVFVDGRETAINGHVRMIRSEPSFTPYYALSGRDAERLSYLAEIALDKTGADLPAGVPVRAEFAEVEDGK